MFGGTISSIVSESRTEPNNYSAERDIKLVGRETASFGNGALLAGHRWMSTTQRYKRTNSDEKRALINISSDGVIV